MQPAVRVENLSKRYRRGVRRDRYRMLREAIVETASASWNRLRRRRSAEDDPGAFLALNNVCFEIQPGEVVGLIGRNGAGKSTLLKVLSRITEPTQGRVQLRGRVGSLLEVGTGFHPELTGRENIYLNGIILGMSRSEIKRKFDEIVAFSEVDAFLDTPVKRYSSGMYIRLAFAVAANLDSEILLVDEVLAVGDHAFQKKCLGKMNEVSASGRTVVFVSHNMAAIENLCNRTIWIADGKVNQDGDTKEVIRGYLNSFGTGHGQTLNLESIHDRGGSGAVRFLKMEFLNADGSAMHAYHSGAPLRVRFHYKCYRDIVNLDFGLRIFSNLGALLSDVHSWSTGQAVPLARKGYGSIDLEIDFLNLMPGTYYLGVWAATDFGEFHDLLNNVATLDVEASDYYGTGRGIEARFGIIFLPFRWKHAQETSPRCDEFSAERLLLASAPRNGSCDEVPK